MSEARDRRPTRGSSRRQLLRWTSGLVAGWALGCPSRPRAPGSLGTEVDLSGIGGSIVGANHRLGHRLRQGGLPEPQRRRDVPVLIVGGGIAGLSAGWKLLGSGFGDFEVLELEDTAGGNSRWGENEVSRFPWGAHYLPLPTAESTAVRELLAEMKMVVDEQADGTPIYDPRHLCHAPHERILLDDGWRDGVSARDLILDTVDASEVAELEAFERQMAVFRNWRDADGRRGFALPTALSSDDPELRELDTLTMRQYFDRAGWRSERLRWYVDYCCRDDYGCNLDTTSAWAGWHYFCSRAEEVEYLTWPEGNGRIVRHLSARLGDRLRTGQLVYRIVPGTTEGSRSEGVEVDVFDARSETVERIRARHLICAVPRFAVPYLIADYNLPGIERFTYSPWVVANLTVRRLPPGAAWDNVIYHSRSLGYVVSTHQNLQIAPGRSVLTYYLPLTDADPAVARQQMLDRGWPEWAERILADLALAHPNIHALVEHLDVMLLGHAMIRPVPGFFWSNVRRRAAEPLGAIRFAHSDMSGLSLFEEAQYQGVRAAEDLMSELGLPFGTSLS